MLSKERLRQQAFIRRDALTTQEIESKSKQIKENLFHLKEFKRAKVICSYVAIRSEVMTHEIIKEAIDNLNKIIIVPITCYDKKELLLSELRDIDNELETVRFGLLEPKPQYQKLVKLELTDLIIVPGVAFDESGYRIGYGGGYYDWLLNQLKDKPSIGLSFESEIVPQIPTNDWDIAVNKIVTEQRVIDCTNHKEQITKNKEQRTKINDK